VSLRETQTFDWVKDMSIPLEQTATHEQSEFAGLSSAEAESLRAEFGPNAVVEKPIHPLKRFALHFWAPVPWMLEAVIALQLFLGEWLTASMIAALLLFNVLLGAFQESRANAALALLKQRLILTSRVKRDGAWIDGPAANLVPGDIVQVSLGDVIPADVLIVDGSLLLDQSMLTGESIPIETGAGKTAFAGGLVRRGGAIARVTATGARTYFGRTAELVNVAHVESAEQKAVLSVVRNLTVINFIITAGLVAYAFAIRVSGEQILLLVLTALLWAVPVALPATFTLAAALGARTLAMKGVLLTRLSSLNEAAIVDVICCDKTGTLTRNELVVSAIRPVKPGYGEEDVLAFAALASSPEGQDPIDSGHPDNGGKRRTPGVRAVDDDALHAVRSGDQNGRGDCGGRGSRDSRGQGLADGRRYGCTDDAGGRERSGRTHPGWISNDRSGRGAERGSGSDRAHRVQRPAARRFGGVADQAAFAGRAPGHDHRRRGRDRGDRRSRDWAHGAGLSAGDHSRARRAGGLRCLRRHFSRAEIRPGQGVPAGGPRGRHVRRRRQ
jgi:magnesium-transporting ATPase (P-type)